jgi:hypothetical protein
MFHFTLKPHSFKRVQLYNKEIVTIIKTNMMISIAIIVSFFFLADFGAAQPGVLDISKFGGAPNADISQVY